LKPKGFFNATSDTMLREKSSEEGLHRAGRGVARQTRESWFCGLLIPVGGGVSMAGGGGVN